MTLKQLLRPLLRRIDPLGLSHHYLYRAMEQRAHYAHGRLLDVGCGRQPYRRLFPHVRSYIGLDWPSAGLVTVYGDGRQLPFRSGSFDTILCNEVLEHVPEPSEVMAEAARVLRPQGILLLTTPQTWGLHMEPHDFYRYTRYGLQYLAEKHGFAVVEIVPTCGLWATLAQRLSDTVVYHYAARSPTWVIRLLSLLMEPVLLIGLILDKLFGKRGDTLDHVLVARRL